MMPGNKGKDDMMRRMSSRKRKRMLMLVRLIVMVKLVKIDCEVEPEEGVDALARPFLGSRSPVSMETRGRDHPQKSPEATMTEIIYSLLGDQVQVQARPLIIHVRQSSKES